MTGSYFDRFMSKPRRGAPVRAKCRLLTLRKVYSYAKKLLHLHVYIIQVLQLHSLARCALSSDKLSAVFLIAQKHACSKWRQ